ncbi:Uncharacterised protein [Mycobacteroides abscessus]|nr:Uncharacterised protein [Mycobacteroides abscessus]
MATVTLATTTTTCSAEPEPADTPGPIAPLLPPLSHIGNSLALADAEQGPGGIPTSLAITGNTDLLSQNATPSAPRHNSPPAPTPSTTNICRRKPGPSPARQRPAPRDHTRRRKHRRCRRRLPSAAVASIRRRPPQRRTIRPQTQRRTQPANSKHRSAPQHTHTQTRQLCPRPGPLPIALDPTRTQSGTTGTSHPGDS